MSEEPSPKDIRRLRALENRLDKSQQTTKELREERNSLRRQLRTTEQRVPRLEKQLEEQQSAFAEFRAEAEETIKALEAQIEHMRAEFDDRERLTTQVTALIEENRRLSDDLEASTKDRQQFEVAAREAIARIEQVRAELNAGFQKQLDAVEKDKAQLETRIHVLNLQLQEEGKVQLIHPENVAGLLGGLMDQLRSGVQGLDILDGEIKLKVGFGTIGEYSGFVIPAADSPPEIKENLHEVTMRFNNRSADVLKIDT